MATCVQVPFRASTASCTVMKEEGERREGKGSKLKWGTLDPQGKISREEKEKQRKHVEAILRAWESLIAQDKEEKHTKLRQKVELQRQLISKVNEQHETLRLMRMEDRKQKEEMARLAVLELRLAASVKKKPVQKRMKSSVSAPSFQYSTSSSTINDNEDNQAEVLLMHRKRGSTAPIGTKTQLTSSFITIPNVEPIHEDTATAAPSNPVMFQYPENKVLQYLGMKQNYYEQVKIEDMWSHMKYHSDRQLHPMQVHLDRLKRLSCPSVKECLEIYDQPTGCDSYTGKTISLTAALKDLRSISEPTKEYTLRLSKSSASLKSKCGQQMIENRAKTRPDKDDIGNEAWFVGLEERGAGERPKSAPAPLTVSNTTTAAAGVRTKSSAPHSATSSRTSRTKTHYSRGSIKSEGDATYKRVKIEKTTPVTSWGQQHRLRTVAGGRAMAKSSAKKQKAVVIQDVSFPNHWEPLSLTALSDANGIHEKAGSGHGEFRNGRVTLWKP